MTRTLLLGIFAVALSQAPAADLRIYVVDVEGGNATLFVTPAGESVLIDTGNGGQAAVRDADRIMAAAKDAGLTRIDHLGTRLEQTHNIVKGEWCQGRFQDLSQSRPLPAIEVSSIRKIRRNLRMIGRYKGHEGRFTHGLEGRIHTAMHAQ